MITANYNLEKIRIVFFLCCFCFVSFQSFSQDNLVVNPSFEDLTSCPNGPSELYKAPPWNSVNIGADSCSSPDLFAMCNQLPFPFPGMNPPVGVPDNLLGSQDALTGENYAGIIVAEALALMGCDAMPVGNVYREYIHGSLTEPLVAGETYCVQFYVTLASDVKWGSDQMGVYLSDTEVQYEFCANPHPLPHTPQLQYTGPPLMNTTDWVLLEWDYVAVGGEQYIVIGNFSDDDNTPLYDSNCGSMNPYVYYYIEDVSVKIGDCGDSIPPDPGEIVVTLDTYPASCGVLGSATITIVDSCTGSPLVEWSTGATGLSIDNLAPGDYSVTISDGPDCDEIIQNFTIADDSFFEVHITTEGNTCSGPVTATAHVDGADPVNVDFSWDTNPPLNAQVVEINEEGTFTVTATYGTCVDTDQVTITYQEFGFDLVYTEFFCAGTSGSAQISNLIGVGPFYFDWSTGDISQGTTFTQPGQICVTVTDDGTGCEEARCVNVDTYPAVLASIDKEDITCAGKNDGTATAVASGGTPPYTYEWTTTATSETINLLGPGTYAVTIMDSNNCMAVASTTIEEPPAFSYSISPPVGICYGEQTTISVVAEGGTPPYSYSWSDAPIDTDERIVSPEETTSYTVSVTDENGCTYAPQTTTISVSAPIVLDLDITDVLCNGLCTGSAVLGISGGSAPLFYHWEYDSVVWQTNHPEALNLCSGDYTVTVIDMFECEGLASFTINQPDTILINTFSGSPSCYGYTDGYVYLEVHGGNPFDDGLGNTYYEYEWSTIGTGSDSIAIGGGYHSVTVTDANDCSHVVPFFISQPEAVYVTNPFGGTICIGQSFTTYAHATGGTIGPNSSYDFVWTAPPDFVNYGAYLTVSPEHTTTYNLIVTDDNGCFGNPRHVTVNVHPPLNIIGISSSPDYICIGESVTVELEVEGGNGGPYSYYFNDNNVVNSPYTFYPQETGYYTFTLEDECGSPNDIDSIYVTVHPLPHINIYADRVVACPPADIQFFETTENASYSYLWNFGDGGYSVQKDPVYEYEETGLYTVSLTAWSEFGCEKKINRTHMIRMYPVPRAEFTASPENASIYIPYIEFRNLTEGGSYYFWDFGDGSDRVWTNEDPTHVYSELGEYFVTLVTKNNFDCYDSITKRINIFDEFSFYAPTAFTPDNDGLNDYFYIKGHGIDPMNFHFSVYDRNGMRLYETDIYDSESPTRMAWDGTNNGNALQGDPILPPGVYIWYCSFLDLNGKPHQKSGMVTLIR
jgi:gliding motility-associated-like protein